MKTKRERQQIEKKILDDLEAFLKLAGIRIRRPLYCGYTGSADLVTDCCVYEAKVSLSSNRLKTGLGQAIVYRNYIDSNLTPVVVGTIADLTNEVVPYIAKAGVAVLGWRPMRDNLFTQNLMILEGIDRQRYQELMDQMLWKIENSGDALSWPPMTYGQECGISAIEHPDNCPLTCAAGGIAHLTLVNRRNWREAREELPQVNPQPMEGLPSVTRVRNDQH